MEIGVTEIIGYVLTFIGGGGVSALVNWRINRKKAGVEVKVDEIKALHDTIELVYDPLVKQLKDRVSEQDKEITSLRAQLAEERESRQKEMKMMNDRILAITSALGLNTRDYIRDNKGRFISKSESD